MKTKLILSTTLCLMAVGLAGCGDGNKATSVAVTPPAATPAFEDQFGTQFGTLYRVAANTDPTPVNDSDVIPLTLIVDPVTVIY